MRILARAGRDDAGRARLDPPDGGFLITNLEVADAMRLLGGPNRRLLAGGIIGLAVAVALIAIGAIGALLSALLSG